MYDTIEEGLDALDQFIDKMSNQDLDESFNSAKEVEKFLVDLFKEKKIWHEFYWEEVEGIKVLCVDVEGDWKHDHAYVDHIMKENGFKLITKVAARGQTGCDGGDWYRAIHIYEAPMEENL